MAHHVRPGELADGDALHPLQHPHGLLQPGHLVRRQVDLGGVPGDDDLGPEAQPGEEHLHLLPAGVLGLVQDDEAVVQRPAPHIGQGGHLDVSPLHVLLIRLRPQHIKQRVVQGAQVGVYLGLQVPRQEAQPLPGLHRGAGEDDPVHLLLPEGRHRRRHRQIGLARPGGAYADGDGVVFDGVHILLLADGLGLDGLALGGDAHHVPGELGDLPLVPRPHQFDDIAHVLLADGLPPGGQGKQALDGLHRPHHVLALAADLQIGLPVHHRNVQLLFDQADVLVKQAEQVDGLLHPLDADALFCHW